MSAQQSAERCHVYGLRQKVCGTYNKSTPFIDVVTGDDEHGYIFG
jgi:hypothetical protein